MALTAKTQRILEVALANRKAALEVGAALDGNTELTLALVDALLAVAASLDTDTGTQKTDYEATVTALLP